MSDANQEMAKVVKATDTKMGPEEDLWAGDFSAKAMYGAWLAAALVTIAGLVALLMVADLRANPIAWYVYAGIVVVVWGYLLLQFGYLKLVCRYELTSQRLRHREGIFVRTMNRIELVDIDDIVFRQGIIQRMLNVGNIVLKSRDLSHPELTLKGISDVKRVADLIDNARIAERRRRAVRFESL